MTSEESREDRIARLQSELAEAMGETAEEVGEVIGEAEESVMETAHEVTEGIQDAHEDIHEAEQEVEEAVHEEAQAAAEELGNPASADDIAEALFRRLDERGLLPHTQHHSVSPVTDGEHITEAVIDTPPEIAAEGAETVTETVRDVAPEPLHWYYRGRLGFRRK